APCHLCSLFVLAHPSARRKEFLPLPCVMRHENKGRPGTERGALRGEDLLPATWGSDSRDGGIVHRPAPISCRFSPSHWRRTRVLTTFVATRSFLHVTCVRAEELRQDGNPSTPTDEMDNLFDHSRARRADSRVIAIRGAREHNLK